MLSTDLEGLGDCVVFSSVFTSRWHGMVWYDMALKICYAMNYTTALENECVAILDL